MQPESDVATALGWMSIACWIVVSIPQFYETYSLQSGEGLSILFVIIWLLGDVSSFVGSAMAGLLPTVIFLALYYMICDVLLLVQIYYYRWKKPEAHKTRGDAPTESSPLLEGEDTPALKEPHIAKYIPSRTALYCLAVAFVAGSGLAAYIVSVNETGPPREGGDEVLEWKSQALGWFSASMYLGSRIPQIIKNAKTKCVGLSLDLFVFALGGNLTYVLSILAESTERQYLIANASWLAGSGLTIFLDLFVLYQFFRYRAEANRDPALEA